MDSQSFNNGTAFLGSVLKWIGENGLLIFH